MSNLNTQKILKGTKIFDGEASLQIMDNIFHKVWTITRKKNVIHIN